MRPPWYAFLYRLFGAQGTFWLWILTLLALWWTGPGAKLSILDREPSPRTVSELTTVPDAHRWVQVSGIRVDLGPTLLETTPPLPRGAILLDSNDPAGAFWARARLLAEVDASGQRHVEIVTAALGDAALPLPRIGRERVRRLLETTAYIRTRKAVAETRRAPAPLHTLLLVIEPASSSSSSGQPVPGLSPPQDKPVPDDPFGNQAGKLERWRDEVRSRVRLETLKGLLDAAPYSLTQRLRNEPYRLPIADVALRVDRKPRDAELYVFCLAALVFVFLATGFHGVIVWQRAISKAPAP